jgi:hypothetical protein
MADVSFTPKFTPPRPWRNNVDRVTAEGAGGFNDRFAAIATDFASLHDVVGAVNTALIALGTQPAPTQQRITVSPALVAVSAPGVVGWNIDGSGFANRPGNQPNVSGVQSVSLPAGAQLVTLRVVGQANSTNAALRVRVALMRSRLLGTPQPAERIVRVEVTSDPFDGGLNIDSALATVSADHRYFLLATAENAVPADIVSLSAFQIIYLAG